ncbi:MAG: 50S ribosomal protein L1 [Nanoarchaeota archaeon]|nr:50S ribosomal protein L1 [Nanoarchaeota archaeon]
MEKEEIKKAIDELKQKSKKRNFSQTYDMIINLKDLDFKKPEQQVDFFLQLNHGLGRKVKVCAFVGPESKENAEAACDKVILEDDFLQYKDKKLVKKLANEFDFFIAQANLMAKVAATFGRVLGTRGKMPNPKAGCVFPPKGNLKPLYEKLQKTIKLSAKKDPIIHCKIGKEDMPDEEIIDNIILVYNQVIHHLPKEKNNMKSVYIKLTMSEPLKIM